jgi:nucleotide-binding universal stress UspA family protein
MYESILIPTDGSAGSDAALRHGIDLAEHYEATVDLVYVVDERVYSHYGGIDAIEHAEEALEEEGADTLAEAREAASLPVDTHIEHTTPHEGILDVARQSGADLIVMGTELRSTEYERFIGRVSDRVVRTSAIPVHLVKAEE